ncbi:MAG: HD domain-containing protein [Lachnospiraceae bacterium]|nr:HD domain-containing protein [Candidatus Colinaster scatohippi]
MDKQTIINKFNEYTSFYDLANPKIRLKYEHTFRVADISQQIAASISGLSSDDIELAWLIGVLHDIGRFEQVTRFGTFADKESVDHASFGADLLFNPDKKDLRLQFDIPDTALVETAIRNHSRFKLPSDLSERELLFCNIIRDADKLDIIRVNVEFTIEEIYNVTEQELIDSDISKQAMDALMAGHAVERNYPMTPMDKVVAHASMMQELVFPLSREILKKQGYLDILLDKHPSKPETAEKLELVKKHIFNFLQQ